MKNLCFCVLAAIFFVGAIFFTPSVSSCLILSGDTVVQMADGTYRKTSDIKAGDIVASIGENAKKESTPVIANDRVINENEIEMTFLEVWRPHGDPFFAEKTEKLEIQSKALLLKNFFAKSWQQASLCNLEKVIVCRPGKRVRIIAPGYIFFKSIFYKCKQDSIELLDLKVGLGAILLVSHADVMVKWS